MQRHTDQGLTNTNAMCNLASLVQASYYEFSVMNCANTPDAILSSILVGVFMFTFLEALSRQRLEIYARGGEW